MGNALLDDNRKQDPVQIYEHWLEQNPDLVSRQILLHNKLFQTCSFKYCERTIKLKVFFRREATPLSEYLKAFQIIHNIVDKKKCMHILPMKILELRDYKDKQLQKYDQNFTLATRQFLHSTLQQKLQAQPRLSEQQKIWIIFQMIFAVYTIHEIFNLYHGHIRTSNFLMTNYQYLIITDFASYKPNYILQDTEQGLSQFRLFYSSSIENCTVAPEKMAGKDNLPSSILNSKKLFTLFAADEINDHRDSTKITVEMRRKESTKIYSEQELQAYKQIQNLKMMDIYSLGISILEVINNGKSTISYEQLLKMKKQGVQMTDKIEEAVKKLKNGGQIFKAVLTGMLKQKPQERPSIISVLQSYVKLINIDIYTLFWCCLSAFNKTSFCSSDLRIHLIYSLIDFIETYVRESNYRFVHSPPKCLAGFKSLKIFVEMIQKKIIFSPSIQPDSIFQKLFKHFETQETNQEHVESQEEIIFEDQDEKRAFFIAPMKNRKIAKRLSFVQDSRIKEKFLCPPNYSQIQTMVQTKQQPLKLNSMYQKSSRFQELIGEYKKTQHLREERLSYKKYYKNCLIIIKIIFSCIRSCKYVANKLLAIEVISLVAKECEDSQLLKVLVPFMMNLTQDAEIQVAKYSFISFINLFYNFVDPFQSQEDIHYFDAILEFFINSVKQPKLRSVLFSNFKEVYLICEWLEIHYRRFNKYPKISLKKIIETIKVNYGSLSKQQIKNLLNNNIPEHLLTDMFQFYISLINTQKLEGLKLSSIIAKNIPSNTHKHILDAFDSCIESGLDEYGIGLFYSIQYFTLRKSTSQPIIKKIAPHVLNPSKWIRDQATSFIRMCLQEFPPTKNFFFFKDIFEAPFPLKPEDLEDEILLPIPLKDNQIDLRQKKISVKIQRALGLTQALFNQYLKHMKVAKGLEKRRQQQIDLWNQQTKTYRQARQIRQILNFKSYIKKQIQQLYEYNLLYYLLNMNSKFPTADKEKASQRGYPELLQAFKKLGKSSLDLNSMNHEKKEVFQQFQGTINSSFQKLLSKKNKENGELPSDKLRLAQSITIIGEVLCKFEMFKIKPIPKLGDYQRRPTEFQKLPKPRGILVSEIFEHKETVSCLQKIADRFFLSGSYDGTMKIFDSKKIQMNITASSEATLEIKGESSDEKMKISSISAFELTYSAVVGSNKGHIRIYPIQRMSGSPQNQRSKNDEIMKYNVNGQIQKVITFSNQLHNQCFCYITAQGNLGIQDIRLKSKTMSCNLGRQRGIPRSICATNKNTILVGTVDGYLINFDIRYNIVSNVLQLYGDTQTLPITNIYPCPLLAEEKEQLYALTYPSKHYQFSYFNIYEDKPEFPPEKQFTSASSDEIFSTPYLVNKTNEQQFKICRNNLIWRKNYDQLSDFNKNFDIYDYLSDPLTRKEAKIREVWLASCKNRYNQISSLYNKKCLPFIEYLSAGILTNCNPCPGQQSDKRPKTALTLLTEKRQNKQDTEIERVLTARPNPQHRVYSFADDENKDYYTCCRVLPTLAVVGCRNSLIKIYM